jgi:dynactin 5
MGEYVIIKDDVIVRPTYGKDAAGKKVKYSKLKIGSYVYIDRGTIVSCLKIGNNVHIGKNCIIGHRCVIKDNVKILDNTILAPETCVPPYTVYGGKPGVFLGELPESFDKFHQDMTINFYKNFRSQNIQGRPGDS